MGSSFDRSRYDEAMSAGASKLARVNGVDLGYQEFGRGTPLILLHGGFGSVEMFGPNIDLLAEGRRVIGVDLQSHGRTPAVDRRCASRPWPTTSRR